MKHTSINISGKVDSISLEIYRAIAETTAELGIGFLVVGAVARDLVLHHGYGLAIQRGTTDLDFAIEVRDWAAYQNLRSHLMQKGFSNDPEAQRLRAPSGLPVDLVPFGELADAQANIAWPPDHAIEMSVLGFQEARQDATSVRLNEEPPLDIPVVSPVGFVLLKLIAWDDRDSKLRRKDATDITYALENYARIPNDVTEIWDELDLIEKYDGDINLVAAALLGRRVRTIAREDTHKKIVAILSENRRQELEIDMDSASRTSPPNNARLIRSFTEGYAEAQP